MFWHKKEDRQSLPDLPPVRSITSPPLPPPPPEKEESSEEIIEKHGLPSFPDSPLQQGFSQAAIKDAVTSETAAEENKMQEVPKPSVYKAVEIGDTWEKRSPTSVWTTTEKGMKMSREFPQYAPQPLEQKNKDVYVRIDKFFSAKKTVETTQKNLDMIEALLKKIRETRLREEQELAQWEKELGEMRIHIRDVTENIFEKVE